MCHLFYLLLPCVSRQHHGRTWWQWRWKVCKLRHMSNMSFVFLLSRWNDANQLCPCFTCCFIGGWLLGSLELDNGFMTVWQAEPLEQVHWNLGGRNYIELTRRIQFLYSQSMWQHVPHSSHPPLHGPKQLATNVHGKLAQQPFYTYTWTGTGRTGRVAASSTRQKMYAGWLCCLRPLVCVEVCVYHINIKDWGRYKSTRLTVWQVFNQSWLQSQFLSYVKCTAPPGRESKQRRNAESHYRVVSMRAST